MKHIGEWVDAAIVALVWAILAVACFGADGIEGPKTSDPGELVILRANVKAAGFAWARVPAGSNWIAVDGGKTVVFATAKSGEYTFLLATAAADVPSLYQHTVSIGGGPSPPVPPVPPVPPDPNPPVPPGPSSAKQVAYDAAMKLPASARAHSSLIGTVFAELATRIPGEIPDAGTLQRATRGARALVLTPDQDAAWEPWAAEVGAWINRQGPVTMADYKRIWTEIAAGLREVR